MTARRAILPIGDLAMMYSSLVLALLIRGGPDFMLAALPSHLPTFTLLFFSWGIVLYISDFYSRRRFLVDLAFARSLLNATVANAFIALTVFYLIGPSVGLTPKTNLALIMALFVSLFAAWRYAVSLRLRDRLAKGSVLFLEPDELSVRLVRQISGDRSIPFYVRGVVASDTERTDLPEDVRLHGGLDDADRLASRHWAEYVVVGRPHFGSLQRHLYRMTLGGSTVLDSVSFWEQINQEIPASQVTDAWLVANFGDVQKRGYEVTRRLRDMLLALVLGVLLAPLMLVIALLVRLTTRGPALYRQVRLGRDGRMFTLLKFRTMVEDAEPDGAVWSGRNDRRVTPLGRFLRHTHLDELPQLWNIFLGDMSFIGPRPERPEFVGGLEESLPYYSLRHLVRPGVSGWAQINYRYGFSTEDSARKLAYDLYYVKHRSHLFDLKIGLKTAAMVFRGEGR